ncbi:hypothetical protein MPOCJGCO_4881 [Methylobacterium trifolii]|uniref:Uncharacterized protein n=1 Tax=Methylobacterium trifolii TaxID=1003092 RepID=A0ABQ4U684_9HYPH|nr:hypothetical protein MPOCJGCO_4881 [Methylobacterium trifolii]
MRRPRFVRSGLEIGRRERGGRRRLQGVLVAGGAFGQPREAGRRQALALEQGLERTQAGAGEAVVGVRRVAQVGDAAGLAPGHQIGLGDGEERPGETQAGGERALHPHPGEACGAAAAEKAHQHGLRLVVQGVPGEHEAGTDRPRMGGEQPVAGGPRGRLKAGGRFRTGPGEDGMPQAERFRGAADRRGLGRGIRAQAVVDRGDVEGVPPPIGGGRVHQRGGIGTARDGQ